LVTLSRWIYSLLLYLLIPLEIIRLLYRSRIAPDYGKRWGERFARTLPDCSGDVIWFHTASVGETLAALPVIKTILEEYPDQQVLVTTMTPTGSERVKALLGNKVYHCYLPYDLPHAMNRFVSHVKPKCLFIMETELWLNMHLTVAQHGTVIVLMNARMSEKSVRGYLRFKQLTGTLIANIKTIAVQNATDAGRFKRLGATPEQLEITGNIKFDLSVPDDMSQRIMELKTHLANRPVWIGASTHKGEDEILLEAHQVILHTHPDCLFILVPRHPERFDTVAELIDSYEFSYSRRSIDTLPSGEVYLADTMGELLLFFALADMAFVGGSLIERGGHNCLEAAEFKKPVMSGPHDFNFAEINRQLHEEGGLIYVSGSQSIAQQVQQWLNNPSEAQKVGQAGYEVVKKNRGALNKLLDILRRYI
jgi:3-deoxy-D-manno-octulosonic-acid transferase